MVVSPRAIKIPAATKHFAIRQIHPNVLLEVAHLAAPATTVTEDDTVSHKMLNMFELSIKSISLPVTFKHSENVYFLKKKIIIIIIITELNKLSNGCFCCVKQILHTWAGF